MEFLVGTTLFTFRVFSYEAYKSFNPRVCHGIAMMRKTRQQIANDQAIVLAVDTGCPYEKPCTY